MEGDIMLKRTTIPWTANQVKKMCENGTMTFDNVVQRGLVWDIKRKSLLIHSMLYGYSIPPFYLIKNDDGRTYDCIDGQQRAMTIKEFLNDEFELEDIPEIVIGEGEDAEEIDINNFVFSELPEEIQDTLKEWIFNFYIFDNAITDEEIAEMFFRLNNGKPLTAIELTRVRAKSMPQIIKLGQHDLFKNVLTQKALVKYTNEDIVIKAYAMLKLGITSLETKVIRPFMCEADITEDDMKVLSQVFDRILSVNQKLVESGQKRAAKRLVTKNHMISLIPMIKSSIDNDISEEDFMEWIEDFYGDTATSPSEEYNNSCRNGSAKKESVQIRSKVLWNSYINFFGEDE